MILRIAAIFAILSSAASAAVTIELGAGIIQSSTNTSVPVGAIGILVADINNAVAGMPTSSELVGLTLTNNTVFGSGGYKIVGVFQAQDLSGTAGVQGGYGGLTSFDLTGGVATGNQLGLFWFPTITTVGATVADGTSYGFYRSSTAADGGTIGYTVPTDGAYSIYGYTTTLGGSLAANTYSATMTATAVPEPSRFCLFGLALMGLIMRRRR